MVHVWLETREPSELLRVTLKVKVPFTVLPLALKPPQIANRPL